MTDGLLSSLACESAAFKGFTICLTDFTGEERVSCLPDYSCEGYVEGKLVHHDRFLFQPVCVLIKVGSTKRYFHGVITNFAVGGKTANHKMKVSFSFSHDVWRLQTVFESWRFEKKSVVDIFLAIFKKYNIRDVDASHLVKDYPTLDHVVQHQETGFDFLQRLLSEHAIDYYFKTSKNKQVMILVERLDEYLSQKQLSYQRSSVGNGFSEWTEHEIIGKNSVQCLGYDYHHATKKLARHDVATIATPAIGKQALDSRYFVGSSHLPRQQPMKQKKWVDGRSTFCSLAPGFNFTLIQHPRNSQNQDYRLARVKHIAKDYSSLPRRQENETVQSYINEFMCHPKTLSTNFASARVQQRRLGSQSAKVEGLADNTLNSTNLAEIKTLNYWQQTANRQATHYPVRVMQPVAGKQWGLQFFPRVGDEVLIRYLYGDPSTPIVLGCLANSRHLPYLPLPNGKDSHYIVTRTAGSNALEKSHQLMFDDSKKSSRLKFSSSRDMNITVEHNITVTVNNATRYSVGNDLTINAKQYSLRADGCVRLNSSGGKIIIAPNKITISGSSIVLCGE